MNISKAELSRLAGVSKPAISKALKAGNLVALKDGSIETENALNMSWLAGHADEQTLLRAAGKGKKAKAATPEPSSAQAPSAPMDGADERLRLTRARRIQAEADTLLKEIRAAREKKELIPRELVQRRMATFDAALKSNFRDMPRRISAELAAIAKTQPPRSVEAFLENAISEALRASVAAMMREELLP